MSQLTIQPISQESIQASPAGLVRASNVVTVTVAAAPATPYSVETTSSGPTPPAGFITALGQEVTIDGSTAVAGNSFEGTFPISAVYPNAGLAPNQFQYLQVAPNDTGGGGTATVLAAGFTDLPDAQLAGNQPLTDVAIQAISHNAKLGIVVREEFTLGYFTSGNFVPTPVSAVDGYKYSLAECIFKADMKSSRQPGSGFTPGQATFPVLANSDLGTGALVSVPYVLYVDRTSGVLICQVYFAGNAAQNQGTVLVTCTGQRGSVNL